MIELDWAVDNVTAAFKRAAMWSNTLIVVVSDNGGPLDHTTNFPLRGGKHTFWEGGIRVVGFVSGPVVPLSRRGATYDGMLHSSDWLPTIVSGVAGISSDELRPLLRNAPTPLDGVDAWSAIVSGGPSPRTEVVTQVANGYWNASSPGASTSAAGPCIRVGEMKLIIGDPGDSRTIAWPAPASVATPFGKSGGGSADRGNDACRAPTGGHVVPPLIKPCVLRPCLFNVVEDPGEAHDLYAEGNASWTPTVKMLLARLAAAAAQGPPLGLAYPFTPTEEATMNAKICDNAKKYGFEEPSDWVMITEAVITTDCGPVRGDASGVYRSIPYATTPARWSHPISLSHAGKCWSGTYDASHYSAQCTELFTPHAGSEDCLSLTVWRAPESARIAPVMVYFHGGDLTVGKATTNFALLAEAGLVIVDVAYRLNAFGFLSLAELTDVNGTSGNYGFLDQQEALRWVQRNIAAFGGDPEKVTIFGQSSGGTSVLCLLASPASKGLFTRAMSLSGSPNITASLATQQQQHAHITRTAGCESANASRSKECMRALSPTKLIAAVPVGASHSAGTKASPSWAMPDIFNVPLGEHGMRMPAIAAVDGVLIPRPPLASYASAPYINVPVVFSTMAQEPGQGPGNSRNASKMTAAQFTAQLTSYFDELFGAGFGVKLAALYADEIAVSRQKAFDSIVADAKVACGNLALAAAAARGFSASTNVYSVVNALHNSDVARGINDWSWHGLDLHYATAVADDAAVGGANAKQMRRWWKEFATNGTVSEWTMAAAAREKNSPRIYTNVLTNAKVEAIAGFKDDVCALWRDATSSSDAALWWWSN